MEQENSKIFIVNSCAFSGCTRKISGLRRAYMGSKVQREWMKYVEKYVDSRIALPLCMVVTSG
jgi:hypothetical protein